MTTLTSIFLQAQAQGGGGGLSGILMIVAMIAIIYFLMIHPHNKKQKEMKRQREAMRKGDKIVTAGGIHGRIREVRQDTFYIEVAPGMTLEVDKTSVYPVNPVPQTKDNKDSKPEKKNRAEEEVKAEEETEDSKN